MFEAEVARGIALLDANTPGWRELVDVDLIDMALMERSDGCGCICTQVYGSFDQGIRELHDPRWPYGFTFETDATWEWVTAHGFAIADGRWDDLDDAWRRALTEGVGP